MGHSKARRSEDPKTGTRGRQLSRRQSRINQPSCHTCVATVGLLQPIKILSSSFSSTSGQYYRGFLLLVLLSNSLPERHRETALTSFTYCLPILSWFVTSAFYICNRNSVKVRLHSAWHSAGSSAPLHYKLKLLYNKILPRVGREKCKGQTGSRYTNVSILCQLPQPKIWCDVPVKVLSISPVVNSLLSRADLLPYFFSVWSSLGLQWSCCFCY